MTDYGIISNIQKYTIHDGPGIRTEVFFKGCSLRCPWCSNPEGLERTPELGFYPDKCLGEADCGWCRSACPAPPRVRLVQGTALPEKRAGGTGAETTTEEII